MDVKGYLKNLMRYCDCNFEYTYDGSSIWVFIGDETSFEYSLDNCRISSYERGRKNDIEIWQDTKMTNVHFAFLIKSALGGAVDYGDYTKFGNANFLDELYEMMEKDFNTKFFSVGKIEEGKLSLAYDKNRGYTITYTFNGNTYVIENSKDKQYIFGRFHNEVAYYISFLEDLRSYTEIFEETFSSDEVAILLGHAEQ